MRIPKMTKPALRRGLLVLLTCAAAAAGCAAIDPPNTSRIVILENEPFICDTYQQPLDIDLLKVTLTAAHPPEAYSSAVNLGNLGGGDCSGRIGRVEIDTVVGDGIKIGAGAHDILIESGRIYAHGKRHVAIHQDGIQVMGGRRITFRRMYVNVPTGFPVFINGQPETMPEDAVLEDCWLRAQARATWTIAIKRSLRSGLRNCVVISSTPKVHRAVLVGPAIDPVSEANTIVGPDQRIVPARPWMTRADLALEPRAALLVLPKVKTVPGSRLDVRLRVGGDESLGSPTCRAAIGTSTLRLVQRKVVSRDTVCSWRVPARSRGKTVAGRVGVETAGAALTVRFKRTIR